MMQSLTTKKLTICICSSKEREKELRQLLATLATEPCSVICEVIVIAAAPSNQLRSTLYTAYLSRQVSTTIEINEPLPYSRLKIIVTANVVTPYCVIIEDSVTIQPGWLSAIIALVDTAPSFDIAGSFHPTDSNDFKTPLYQLARSKRPWAKDIGNFPEINQTLRQQCLLVKTSYIHQHGFPDYAMQGLYDEPLLMDMVSATRGITRSFDDTVERLISYGADQEEKSDITDLARPQTGVSDLTLPFVGPLFTTCITTYGDYPKLIGDCLSSALEDSTVNRPVAIIVGCNGSSEKILEMLNEKFTAKLIQGLIRSHHNVDKSGMQRYMYRMVETPYAFSVDDDTLLLRGWIRSLNQLITQHHPIALGGFVHEFADRNSISTNAPSYMHLVTKKHWWRNNQPLGNKVVFARGNCFLVKINLVRYFNFPDIGMESFFEDVLLGDLVLQVGGKMVNFPPEIQTNLSTNRAPSRGVRSSTPV